MSTEQQRGTSIYTAYDTAWALRMIAAAKRGDGNVKSDNTPDGVADAMLREGIERRYPGLLDTYRKRAAIDQEGVKLAITMLEKERSAAV